MAYDNEAYIMRLKEFDEGTARRCQNIDRYLQGQLGAEKNE